ncbi:hypothetical protein B0T19DRAFT_46253 [Cercophora scortea]|uniref:Uncharacterized protein n=1 Tax=Cercophora scortea TaxID=314031 RepID=A0AAE0J4X6_9PEZI|nr:hypothetical protein B0T19DRAFT_46253 [Cercophora scortea]
MYRPSVICEGPAGEKYYFVSNYTYPSSSAIPAQQQYMHSHVPGTYSVPAATPGPVYYTVPLVNWPHAVQPASQPLQSQTNSATTPGRTEDKKEDTQAKDTAATDSSKNGQDQKAEGSHEKSDSPLPTTSEGDKDDQQPENSAPDTPRRHRWAHGKRQASVRRALKSCLPPGTSLDGYESDFKDDDDQIGEGSGCQRPGSAGSSLGACFGFVCLRETWTDVVVKSRRGKSQRTAKCRPEAVFGQIRKA